MSSSARQCRHLGPVLYEQTRQPLGPVQSPPERGERRRAAVAPVLGPQAQMHLTIGILVPSFCAPGFFLGYFLGTFSSLFRNLFVTFSEKVTFSLLFRNFFVAHFFSVRAFS